ncbi:MAG: hypothetical protein ABSD59_17935 [Terracidiphilus sp.]
MNDFVIELILVVTIVVPLIASSPVPARAVSRHRTCLFRKLHRSH